MNVDNLPTLNAALNCASAVLLSLGYLNIRKGEKERHRKFMLGALIVSGLFLISYTVYHYSAGSRPYPYDDWTRPLYFAILIPHVILASVMTPFIVWGVSLALRGKFAPHKKLMRFIWPVWMFVSVSGVAVYVMLYRL